MADINSVVLVGRLTRDVELSYTPSNNTALAKFPIAVNEYRGGQKEVNYFDIVVWGKSAENCNQFLAKGRQVVINGRLRQERFQDKEGQNRSKVSITAHSVQFVGGRDDNNTGEFNSSQNAEFNSPKSAESSENNSDFDNIDFGKAEPDDIPF